MNKTTNEGLDFANRSYVGAFGASVTDDYQIKMMYALWKARKMGLVPADEFDAETTFQLAVRGYANTGFKTETGADSKSAYWLISGMQFVREWVEGYKWNDETLRRLSNYKVKGKPYYDPEFIEFLRNDKPHFTVEALPDGELGFARQSLLTVKCPRYQKQLFETFALNIINSSIDVSTVVSHAVRAANGKAIIDMSLRRSKDLGGLATTLATMIGGAIGTSNVLAYELYDTALIGTMAHAWIMDFPTEQEAFDVWTQIQPEGMRGYLVDTYDSIQGVKNVIASCKKFGVKPDLIRNDSSDQVAFCAAAEKLLIEAGFGDCMIVVTNDMNAPLISKLEKDGIRNTSYGMGTWQCTQKSPGAVYKQAMTIFADGSIHESMKMSDEFKSTFPGAQKTIRILNDDGSFQTDIMVPYLMNVGEGTLDVELKAVSLLDKEEHIFPIGTKFYNPHVTLCADGKVNYENWPTVAQSAALAKQNLTRLPAQHRDSANPIPYAVHVEAGLYQRFRTALDMNDARKGQNVPEAPNFTQPLAKAAL